ncbi:hypothetical protein RB653_010444 [Dictyostelium firmibasis]|uniref:Uncharacterized protein n=1 Tax=Dictyostelium firmibasis TaxID=79012 RepID=A0AAN7TTR8_9MYCE
MCLGFLSFYQYEGYPVIILNNREEEESRPTKLLYEWENIKINNNENSIKIYGGRDQIGGGTWLAVNNKGKFCMLLNSYYRNEECFLAKSASPNHGKMSRGTIVYDYLIDDDITPFNYIQRIEKQRNNYQPFKIIVGKINIKNNNEEKDDNDGSIAYYYNSHFIPPNFNDDGHIDENISTYPSLLKSIEKGTLFGISNFPNSCNTKRKIKGKDLLEKKLNSIFHKNHSNSNSSNKKEMKSIILNENNENELIDIMLLKTIENEPPAPMEHINTSSIFVPPYTSSFSNKIRSTVSTSLITFQNINNNNNNNNNNDNTNNNNLLTFAQIDHIQKKKNKIQQPII